MRRLYLLRHAKSSWADSSLADHDRPLSARGRKAARRLAAHLSEQGIQPELVLCSSARRTRETLERLGRAVAGSTVEIEEGLYAAGADVLADRLHRVPDDVSSVMLVGHNPGLELLVLALAGQGERLTRVREKFPTGALATLELTTSWAGLSPGSAELTGFVVPRELD